MWTQWKERKDDCKIYPKQLRTDEEEDVKGLPFTGQQ